MELSFQQQEGDKKMMLIARKVMASLIIKFIGRKIMDYIYMRVSTEDQTTQCQLLELRALYPNAKIIEETVSGMKERPLLKALVASMVAGDRLILFSLDRLGRRAHEVLTLLEDLKKRGITLISKREGVDYNTMAGKLVTQIFISFAEMERELIVERTKAGLKAARERGAMLGTPKEIPEDLIKEAIRLVEEDGLSIPKAAAECKYIAKSKPRQGQEVTLSVSYLRKIMKKKNDILTGVKA